MTYYNNVCGICHRIRDYVGVLDLGKPVKVYFCQTCDKAKR